MLLSQRSALQTMLCATPQMFEGPLRAKKDKHLGVAHKKSTQVPILPGPPLKWPAQSYASRNFKAKHCFALSISHIGTLVIFCLKIQFAAKSILKGNTLSTNTALSAAHISHVFTYFTYFALFYFAKLLPLGQS